MINVSPILVTNLAFYFLNSICYKFVFVILISWPNYIADKLYSFLIYKINSKGWLAGYIYKIIFNYFNLELKFILDLSS